MRFAFEITGAVAGVLVLFFLIAKCFALISMKSDFMVIAGIVGLLIILFVLALIGNKFMYMRIKKHLNKIKKGEV